MVLKSIAEYCRTRTLYTCFLALLVLAFLMQSFALPSRSLVKLDAGWGQSTLKFMPSIITHPPGRTTDYTYSLSLYYTDVELQQTGFSITPSSCIKSFTVNLKPVPVKRRYDCDNRPGSYWIPYNPPLSVDLAPYVQNGRNLVQVTVAKPEFNMGPIIFYDFTRLSRWIGLALLVVCCIAITAFMQRYTGERVTGYLMSAGLLVFMNRMAHTGPGMFAMDLPGHIEYINFIADQWSLPKPYWGWSYYHPPLYYFLGALVIRISNFYRSIDPLACLQFFNMACFMTFIGFSALTLQCIIHNKKAYYIALTLLVFYPGGILFAARIDSNLLYYACYAACLYFTFRWVQQGSPKMLGLTIAMLGLSFATRMNTLFLIPLLVLAAFAVLLRHGRQKNLLQHACVRVGLMILILGLSASIGRTEYYHLIEARHDPLVAGNSNSLSRRLLLQPATLTTLAVPNLSMYFKHSLWDVWDDSHGRQYFWNSVLKSSMFGEFILDRKGTARVLSALLMAMIVFTFEGYVRHRRILKAQDEWWACLVTLAVPLAALMENRLVNAFACSEDFRYIYPALASFCGLYGLVLQAHIRDWRPFRAGLGAALVIAFAGSSVYFYYIG